MALKVSKRISESSMSWQDIFWNTMAAASDFCAGAVIKHAADMEKGYRDLKHLTCVLWQ